MRLCINPSLENVSNFILARVGPGVLFGVLLGRLLGAFGTPLGDFGSTLAALGVALETVVGLWALWVDLGRDSMVSVESLARCFKILVQI